MSKYISKENESLTKHPVIWLVSAVFLVGTVQTALLTSNTNAMQGISTWMIWLFMCCLVISCFLVGRSGHARAEWRTLFGFPVIGMLLFFIGITEIMTTAGAHYDASRPFAAAQAAMMPTIAVLGVTVGPVALTIFLLVKAWPDRLRLFKAS